jgi:predicted dehydrogenase
MIGAGDVCERKSGPPLYRIPGSELVLVHRRNREAGPEYCRRHAGRYEPSLDALLASDEIDAVYVASPHDMHADHSIAALEAGKHVLVEKPMATSAADCARMVEAAKRAGRSLGVAYYRRGYRSVQRVREIVTSGAIGAPRRMSVNSEFPTSHRLDLVHYLLGRITAVRALPGGSQGYRFERMAGRIEARVAAATVTMSDTWTETGMPEALVIEGESGSIHLHDLKGGSLTVTSTPETAADTSNATIPHKPPARHEELGGLPWTHWGLIENFVAHLQTGAALLCDGAEGRRSTVILDALAAVQERHTTDWTTIEEG